MRRCLQLAANGRQNAKPNPMVGAVIVAADGRIIGEGYHVRCGEGHAEVNAFASVRPEDEALLAGATIYVSLEPCSHYGKTPPCADLIIKKGVRRCVVGCVDPFAAVQGRGIQKLRDAGIEVTVGVLEEECRELNRRFITFNEKRRPYIILKWAQTANAFLDDNGKACAISTPFTKMLVHKLRAEKTPFSWVASPTNANNRASTCATGRASRHAASSSTATDRRSRAWTSRSLSFHNCSNGCIRISASRSSWRAEHARCTRSSRLTHGTRYAWKRHRSA